MSIENNFLKFSIVLYVLGFIVHNVYLSQFGNHEFELIQAKYILSGFGLVGFSAICVAYISIKVNLSYIGDSLQIDNILPWLLRAFSLPYVLYALLYPDALLYSDIEDASPLSIIILFNGLAHMFVFFSVADTILMASDGDTWYPKIIRSSYRVFAIPMIVVSIIIAIYKPEFYGILLTVLFFFFGFIGHGFYQADKKHGIDPNYLDSDASKEHEDSFQIFFGIIATFFLLWIVISNYTKYVYPQIPVALGGAKIG